MSDVVPAPPRRLRVLMWYWGRSGGGARYTWELARVLAADPELELSFSLSRHMAHYREMAALDHERWHDLATYTTRSGFVARTMLLPVEARRFASFVRRGRFDAVLAPMEHLWSPVIAPWISRGRLRYVLVVHDARRHPGDGGAIRNRMLASHIARTDAVVTLSDAVTRQLVDEYDYPPDRIHRSVLGIHTALAPSARVLRSDRPIRLVFFGRLLPYKGIDALLDAVTGLRDAGVAVRLEIWGEGDLGAHNLERCRTLGVKCENRWIAEGEIDGVIGSADLVVLPYKEASQSGVITLACAHGVPCVVTPVGGLAEQVNDGESGVVARGMTGLDVAEAIRRATSSVETYRQLSEGALRVASETMSWSEAGSSVAAALKATCLAASVTPPGR